MYTDNIIGVLIINENGYLTNHITKMNNTIAVLYCPNFYIIDKIYAHARTSMSAGKITHTIIKILHKILSLFTRSRNSSSRL